MQEASAPAAQESQQETHNVAAAWKDAENEKNSSEHSMLYVHMNINGSVLII